MRRARAAIGADGPSLRPGHRPSDDAERREDLRKGLGKQRQFGHRRPHLILRRDGMR
jgi:hypothetical protein